MRVITGKAKGVQLKTPDGLQTRPTADRVKEALFSMLQFELPGAKVLDLFGGTGQLGIECLSRGAQEAVFVDASDKACALIRENLKRTKLAQQATVHRCDYMDYLKRCSKRFDIILLDPPYAEAYLESALKYITEIDILESNGIIVTERPAGKELPFAFEGFSRSRDYRYAHTVITIFRKKEPLEYENCNLSGEL